MTFRPAGFTDYRPPPIETALKTQPPRPEAFAATRPTKPATKNWHGGAETPSSAYVTDGMHKKTLCSTMLSVSCTESEASYLDCSESELHEKRVKTDFN